MPEVWGQRNVHEPQPAPDPLEPNDCWHRPDMESVHLDCEPTNEWAADCEHCGVLLWAQADEKPGDNPHEWEVW